MFNFNGQIDENDLIHIREMGIEPIAAYPAPITEDKQKRGLPKWNPHVSRFMTEDFKFVDVFHIKPIYYLHANEKEWRPLSEVCNYYGNKNGMEIIGDKLHEIHPKFLQWYSKRLEIMKGQGIKIKPVRVKIGEEIKLWQ